MNNAKTEVLIALDKRNLLFTDELKNIISQDFPLQEFPYDLICVTESFIKTYEMRLEALRKMENGELNSLQRTTTEMLDSLRRYKGGSFHSYKVIDTFRAIYFRFGITEDYGEILFIHKLPIPRELSRMEKEMVGRGEYVRLNMEFEED